MNKWGMNLWAAAKVRRRNLGMPTMRGHGIPYPEYMDKYIFLYT